MTEMDQNIPVYLEIGTKKVVAGALDWPGWCRIAKNRESALHELAVYSQRYARVMALAGLPFPGPVSLSGLQVIEELEGNRTTDFGAPAMVPEQDNRPLDQSSLERLLAILGVCWQAYDETVEAATGKSLSTGPRGGGRDLDKIQEHVLGAEQAYLGKLAWKYEKPDAEDPQAAFGETRRQVRLALEAGLKGELPGAGPRGGSVWPPRYFVRRTAWHVLDHTWEIEDRIV